MILLLEQIANCARWRRLLAAMMIIGANAALAAPACVERGGTGGTGASIERGIGGTGAPAESGIGGTGAPQASGIGGTGAPQVQGIGGTGAPQARGIGGTGALAQDGGIGGTGIVGTITGFASVCVNGLEVHYDEATPVSMNGRAVNAAELAVGQVIAVEAQPGARGLSARSIAVLNALEGPITAIGAGRLEVMGQPVRLAPGLAGPPAGLAPGVAVRVSGLRAADGTVLATHLSRAPAAGAASAIGDLAGTGERRSLHGLPLSGAPAAERGEVLVRGDWDGQRLHVRELRRDPSAPFAGQVERLVVEGLVQGPLRDRTLRVGGFEAQISAATRFDDGAAAALSEGRRVRVAGRAEGARRLLAERVSVERGGPGGGTRLREPGSGKRDEADSKGATDDGGRGSEARGDEDRSGSGGGEDRSGSGGGSGSGSSGSGGSDRVERIERIDRPDRPDRPERIERPERPERPERVERPERPERSGNSGSGGGN